MLPLVTVTFCGGTVMTGGARMVVSSVAVLLAGVAPNSAANAETLLVRVPLVVESTTILTEAVASAERPFNVQVTLPALVVQLPWLGVAETKVTPAGSRFVRRTAVALEGPALLTRIE